MTARNQVAQLDVQTIDSLRSGNSTMANWLRAAPGFEIFGWAALTYPST